MSEANSIIVRHLNTVLRNELTAINQYFLHSRMLRHQGFAKLAAHEYEESIDEMKHADQVIARVLFLGGIPNLQDLGKLMVGEHPKEMLECDLSLEQKAVTDLREGIAVLEGLKDFTSADLLHEILKSEEGHIDWLRQQLDVIASVGIENYLATQL